MTASESPLKVAVSGASGFVGSALQKELQQRGAKILRLVRSRSEHEASPDDTVFWDPLGEGLSSPNSLNDLDALFHLAGRSIASRRWNASEKELIRSSRVDATQLLCEQLAAIDEPPKVLISASAIGIYGDHGDSEIIESSSQAQGFLADVARGWENACEPLEASKTRVVHPRLGVVLGKGGGALRLMLPVFRFGLGGKIGDGQQFFSWVSLDDCVRSLLWLADTETATGAYNVVSPEPVRNAVFADTLAAVLGRPSVVPAPAFAVKLALGQEMADALLLNSQRVLPQRLASSGFEFQDPKLKPFLERLHA